VCPMACRCFLFVARPLVLRGEGGLYIENRESSVQRAYNERGLDMAV